VTSIFLTGEWRKLIMANYLTPEEPLRGPALIRKQCCIESENVPH
jgi:hypothetical protein